MDPAPVGRFVVRKSEGVGEEGSRGHQEGQVAEERVVGQGGEAQGVEEEQNGGQAQQQKLLVATTVSGRLHFCEPQL